MCHENLHHQLNLIDPFRAVTDDYWEFTIAKIQKGLGQQIIPYWFS